MIRKAKWDPIKNQLVAVGNCLICKGTGEYRWREAMGRGDIKTKPCPAGCTKMK